MRVAILDSDEQNIKYLSQFMKKEYAHWIVNSYATTFALATAVYDEFKGDVELLMVHVESDSSIELAKDMQEYFPHIRVIFYAETTDCAEKIFWAVPTFFMRLPFCDQTLEAAFERVRLGCEEDVGRTLTIQAQGQKQKIRFSAILYMESFARKMLLYTDNGSFETYMTVKEALDKLPQQFLQCHRSYIVNKDRIEKYSSEGVLLTDGALIPISRSYQKIIKESLGEEQC